MNSIKIPKIVISIMDDKSLHSYSLGAMAYFKLLHKGLFNLQLHLV